MNKAITSNAMLKELSERIKEYRINMSVTQKELAEKSGVSPRSITRFEQGEDIQLNNFLKILKALSLESNVEMLVPDQRSRPSYYLEQGQGKKRARASRKKTTSKETFKWGDEE